MTKHALAELTDPTMLRVGINLGNPLLVTGTSPTGDPEGVAPDMAAAIALRLGVAVSHVTFATPGEVAGALERDDWDIGLIAVEPARAEKIAFSNAYVEIEATYLVPANSPFQSIEDVDQPGTRIRGGGSRRLRSLPVAHVDARGTVPRERHCRFFRPIRGGKVGYAGGPGSGIEGKR